MNNRAFSTNPAARTGPVIACLDRSRHAAGVLAHALAMAEALSAPLSVVQAIEPPTGDNDRPDPLDWAVRRLEARDTLKRLIAEVAGPDHVGATAVTLLHGRPADQIRRERRRQRAGLVVLGMRGEHENASKNGLGATARDVLEQDAGMVLVTPDMAGARPLRSRRILVPMDGSSWSETALLVAARIARATGAALTLVQVVVAPDPAGALPPECEDIELRARIMDRDERIATGHLEQLRRGLVAEGVPARALTLRGDDARAALSALLAAETFDLVVMSACGQGGGRLSGGGCGGVATHLAGCSPAPLLIVRPVVGRPSWSGDMAEPASPRVAPTPPAEARFAADAAGPGW